MIGYSFSESDECVGYCFPLMSAWTTGGDGPVVTEEEEGGWEGGFGIETQVKLLIRVWKAYSSIKICATHTQWTKEGIAQQTRSCVMHMNSNFLHVFWFVNCAF